MLKKLKGITVIKGFTQSWINGAPRCSILHKYVFKKKNYTIICEEFYEI